MKMTVKKNKILLIFPKVKTVVLQPPLAVLTLASVLKRFGFVVQVVDRRVEKDSKRIIQESLEKKDILSVGISTMTGSQIEDAVEMAKFVKEHSDTPVVFGGIHPTSLPEQTLKNEYIDYVITGMGEVTFLNFNRLLAEGRDFYRLKGLCYKRDGKIVINPHTHENIKLDLFPPPAWEMVNVHHYLEKGFLGKNTLTLIGSRGCPHRCTFCYGRKFFNKAWFGRNAENVLEELDGLLKKYPMIDSVYFNDDNFIVDRERMMKICKGLKKRNLKYSVFSRADYIDEDLIKFLRGNNCIKIGIGAESGSQKILDMINKDIKVKHLINTAELCNRYGIKSFFSFMVGHPLETKEDLNMTFDLIDKLIEINPIGEITDLKIMTPYPGTEFYETAINHGFKPPKTLEEWGTFEWNTCKLPWIKNRKKYETMSFAVLLTFYRNRIKRGGKLSNFVIEVLHKIEKFRWKHRLWGFGIEGSLIKFYVNKISKIS